MDRTGVDDRVARAQEFISTPESAAGPKSTGKEGTDIPPLVVSGKKDDGRAYVSHPDDRAAAEADLQKALDDRVAYPSFTTVLPSPPLVNWATAQSGYKAETILSDYIAASPDERARMEEELLARDRYGKSNLYKLVSSASRKKADDAATRGTGVHALLEDISKGGNPDIPEEARGYIEAYRGFEAEYPDIEYVYTEATCLNEEAGSMGTVDAIVRIGGKTYILDYKTNKNAAVYSKTGMQLAAGANADWIVYPDGRREPMPHIDGGIGVGLGPDGTYNVFRFDTSHDGDNNQAFNAAVQMWHWDRHHKSSEKVSRADLG